MVPFFEGCFCLEELFDMWILIIHKKLGAVKLKFESVILSYFFISYDYYKF